jgi:hypothetical protein
MPTRPALTRWRTSSRRRKQPQHTTPARQQLLQRPQRRLCMLCQVLCWRTAQRHRPHTPRCKSSLHPVRQRQRCQCQQRRRRPGPRVKSSCPQRPLRFLTPHLRRRSMRRWRSTRGRRSTAALSSSQALQPTQGSIPSEHPSPACPAALAMLWRCRRRTACPALPWPRQCHGIRVSLGRPTLGCRAGSVLLLLRIRKAACRPLPRARQCHGIPARPWACHHTTACLALLRAPWCHSIHLQCSTACLVRCLPSTNRHFQVDPCPWRHKPARQAFQVAIQCNRGPFGHSRAILAARLFNQARLGQVVPRPRRRKLAAQAPWVASRCCRILSRHSQPLLAFCPVS